MHVRHPVTIAALLGLTLAVTTRLTAQAPAAPAGGAAAGAATAQAPAGRGAGAPAPAQGGRGRGPATFPAQQRQLAAPEVVEKGKSLYSVTCTACHGNDLRGGQLGGPNLLRSAVVLNDDLANLLVPIFQGSRAERGMPAFPFGPDDTNAIAAYLHSVIASSRGQGAPPPGPPVVLNVLVGNATAGAAYFQAKCSTCHSATGDLQGIATRIPDAKALQNLWVAGGGRGGAASAARRTVTATVTPAAGQKTEGRLVRIDDFLVTLALADGSLKTFRRDGDVPKVEITDPLQGHRDLLRGYSNKDMHDVTAYLVTLK